MSEYKAVLLRNKKDIDLVLTTGNRCFGYCGTLYYRSNDTPNETRFFIITYKRNLRLAVMRNQFRRVAKEQLRLKREWLKGFDIVIVAKKQINKITNSELSQCVGGLLACFIKQLRNYSPLAGNPQ